MGLFKILKKNRKDHDEDIVVEDFDKKVLESSNLLKDLKKLASSYNLTLKELDFNILSYKTFYKSVKSPRFIELLERDRKRFFLKENILNPDIEMMQKVKVEVFKRDSAKFPLKISIGGNKELTKVFAKFAKSDRIEYFDGLESDIIEFINKRLVLQNILLGCFDHQMHQFVKKVVSKIRVNGFLDSDTTIILCEGYDSRQPTKGNVIYSYKQKQELEKVDKVDHSKRGVMHTIKEGDTLIEVLKESQGSAGRNCRGEIILTETIELSDEIPNIEVSEDIEKQELEDKIIFLAKKSGFVYESKPNYFEIKDELVVDEVSFKNIGSIDAGKDKEIKINIDGKDSMSDAIGSGVSIDTSEIRANGNVGSGATVKANIIEIGGQVHQTSKLFGGDVKINLHKGFVDGDNIEIDLIEGGKVVGDVVRVKKASGGEIEAREVYIQTVLSNVIVRASNHIELDKIEGNGNKFIIDAKAQRGFAQKVQDIEEGIKDKIIMIKKLTQKIKQLRKKINTEKDTSLKIIQRIKELKGSGANPPVSLVNKLRDNQNRVKEHNLLLKELKDAKISHESLVDDLHNLQSSVFSAKVINHSAWKDFNEVIFKVIDPPVETSTLFKDGDVAKEIKLFEGENGDFNIKRGG